MTDFKFRRTLLVSTLLVMLIPNTALVLPIFLEINAVHLVGTPWAVILPFSFFPFGVYLTYIYFSTSISHDLLDAARVDGASEFKVFRRIAMPLAMPVIALVGFFSFVNNWNNYFLPFVMVPGRKAPIQVGLAELISNIPLFNPTTVASVTHQPPATRSRDGHLHHPRADRVLVLTAIPRGGPHRRGDKGVGPPSLRTRRFGMASRMLPDTRDECLARIRRGVAPRRRGSVR